MASQDELRRKLATQGFAVTQATLSRDIHELQLMKGPAGYIFSRNGEENDEDLPSVDEVLQQFGLSAVQAMNQIVLRTTTGSAQPVAAAMDLQTWDGVLGTIAGDDTILLICRDAETAAELCGRLEGMMQL